MKLLLIRLSCAGALLAIVGLLDSTNALAIDNPWNAATGNWNVPANWGNGEVPNATNDQRPVLGNGGTAQVSTTVPTVAGLIIGQNAGETGTTEILPGGTLNVLNSVATGGGVVTVGALGTGTLRMTGGTLGPVATPVPEISSGANALDVIDLSGSAIVNPQVSFLRGTTRITGPSVNFTARTTLVMDPTHNLIASITNATTHSALKSTGPMTVAGTLNAEFVGVTPAFGQAYNVADANILVGNFSNFANVGVTGVPAPVLGEVYRVKRTTGGTQGQVLQLIRDKVLALQVDRDSGAVSILNPLGGSLQIDGYTISSAAGSLKPGTGTGGGAWNSLTNQAGFSGWGRDGVPTATGLGETKNVGSSDFTAISSQSLGNAYDEGNAFLTNGIGASGQDLVFDYSTAAGEVIRGQVTYVGIGKTNNLLLTIDSNGAATLKNDSPGNITVDSYSILSTGGALTPGGFNDAATANLTAASPTASAISELATNPNAPLVIAGGTTFSLGNIFNAASPQTGVSLEFTTADQNILYNGVVRFAAAGVSGDYNNNGVVDAADYVLWRNGGPLQNDPTPGVQAGDYTYWKSRFGATTGAGSSQGAGANPSAVPEPTSLLMLISLVLVGQPVMRISRRVVN
jgi:hypothetical protein